MLKSGERHGRVMGVIHFTCIVQKYPKEYSTLTVDLRGGEEVVAHGHTDFAFGDDIDIAKTNGRPPLIANPLSSGQALLDATK